MSLRAVGRAGTKNELSLSKTLFSVPLSLGKFSYPYGGANFFVQRTSDLCYAHPLCDFTKALFSC